MEKLPELKEESVRRTDLILKKSKKLLSGYKETIAELDGHILTCSKDKINRRIKCVLNFALFDFQCTSVGNHEFRFEVTD